MIRHIVLFRLKDSFTGSNRTEALTELKKHIEELPHSIDLIRRCEVGIDVRHLETSYDIILTMDFDSMADLDAYTVHPDHQDFIRFNKDFSAAKVCIDYPVPDESDPDEN